MIEQEKRWNFDEYVWIEEYDERMRNKKRLRYNETLSEVVRKAHIKEDELVLDIGTGTGNLAIEFLQNGCKIVVGLDLSAKMLQIAERKAVQWKDQFQIFCFPKKAGLAFQIQKCENPFLEIPFPDQTFDVVASTYSIHHITDDAKGLSIREA